MADAQRPPQVDELCVLDSNDALAWWPSPNDAFIEPSSAEAEELRDRLKTLPEGACVPCRGRDPVHVHVPAGHSQPTLKSDGSPDFLKGPCSAACRSGLSEWDYGYLVKRGERLYFLYETGDLESFRVS
eukprot:SAG11_NODE_1267_length_5342_cov_1.772459_10_plen_129_part_00